MNKTWMTALAVAAGLAIGLTSVPQVASGQGIIERILKRRQEKKRANLKPSGRYMKPADGVQFRVLLEKGGHLDWSSERQLLAYDQIASDGYYDLYAMKLDGSGKRCLSCGLKGLTKKHVGQPEWHPNGDYIVFQGEKESAPKAADNKAVPGAGALNDLYAMTADGTKYWKIREVSSEVSKDAEGVLHAHFSHDGRTLFWAERKGGNDEAFGEWKLMFGDWTVRNGQVSLTNVREVPFDQGSYFYESHGFSPDDSKILFTSTRDGNLEIYTYDLNSRKITRLTNSTEIWDEHAHFSPDGKKITWISSEGLIFSTRPFELQTEIWMMDADGSNKVRVTGVHEPGWRHARNGFVAMADNDWVDNDTFVVLGITGRPETTDRGSGFIAVVDLPAGLRK